MKENKTNESFDGKAQSRAERIAKKSAMIAQKGERIAKRNGERYSFESPSPSETEEKSNQIIDPVASDGSHVAEPADLHESTTDSNTNGKITFALLLSSLSVILSTLIVLCSMLGAFPSLGSTSNEIIIQVSEKGPVEYVDSESNLSMLEDVKNSVVFIEATYSSGSSLGSGIIITSDGYIVTNYHVIEDASNIYVTTYGSDIAHKAAVIGYSAIDDIAVLKIEAKGLHAAIFAKSANCRVGEKVYAIGSPKGIEFAWSVSQGIISFVDREIHLYDNEGILEKKMYALQTDTPLNPGNSGGPLINERGEVVGIITLKLPDSVGMGFAIPADGALELITAIIKTGSADGVNSTVTKGRPLIGITGVAVMADTWYENYIEENNSGVRIVDEEYAQSNPDNTFYAAISGVHVSALTEGLDAKNKLKENDIITKVNGYEVYNIFQVMDIINTLDGGDNVEITYYRDGKYNKVTITLGTAKD